MYNVQCTICSVQWTVYCLQCLMYSVHFTVYYSQYTVYSVHCARLPYVDSDLKPLSSLQTHCDPISLFPLLILYHLASMTGRILYTQLVRQGPPKKTFYKSQSLSENYLFYISYIGYVDSVQCTLYTVHASHRCPCKDILTFLFRHQLGLY